MTATDAPSAPIVIAHRGASGYLPEHTLEAKILAYGFGVDYLEQDVVGTRDGELVVLHDVELDYVTDVARRFPDRRRADGHWYAVYFDLAELQTLEAGERRRRDSTEPLYAGRYAARRPVFRIATLDDEIELIRGMNAATGRNVGLYTEIKRPDWHRAQGIDLSRLVLECLATHGYERADDAVFVQCFDARELHRMRDELGCELALVQLVDAHDASHAGFLTPAGLRDAARYAQAIGPPYGALVESVARRSWPQPAPIVSAAHDTGLAVHAYTFRREQVPEYASSFEALLEFFLGEVKLDGVFCDQPDVAVRVRGRLRGSANERSS